MNVTTTTNEAAERLRDAFGAYPRWPHERLEATLDDALRAERRATVDRIRERWVELLPLEKFQADLLTAILDEEAVR